MAKGIGLIGNFRGKVGNMVGYNLKDSNNKQTQGVRVYQPVVKNPKTYGQALQRAKLAPINATYRALKPIIDRGQESKAYGNKSRLAWLKEALKSMEGPWFVKGAGIDCPTNVAITKGSLGFVANITANQAGLSWNVTGVATATTTTVGALATALKAAFPVLEDGDQLTLLAVSGKNHSMRAVVESVLIDTESTDTLPAAITISDGKVQLNVGDSSCVAATVILSREGTAGQHLRNTAVLTMEDDAYDANYSEDAKEEAIQSYMAGSTTSDWPEEQLPRE